MAYTQKTWKDRITEHPNRRVLTPVDGATNTYDAARAEGNIMEEGDPLNAASLNDLEQRVADAVAGAIPLTDKGAAGGVASLGADGIVPLAQQGIVSGSNANGSYIKYPDGTMICRAKILTLTTAGAGNWVWTFPAPFISTDISVPPQMGVGADGIPRLAKINGLNVAYVEYIFYTLAGAAAASTTISNLHLLAVGRWKN